MKKSISPFVAIPILAVVIGVCCYVYSRTPIEQPPARDTSAIKGPDMGAMQERKKAKVKAQESKNAESKSGGATKTDNMKSTESSKAPASGQAH